MARAIKRAAGKRVPAKRQAAKPAVAHGMVIKVVRLPHAAGLPLPTYQSKAAAGLDLIAALPEAAPLLLAPGARALVPTGLVLEIPVGFEGQVRPRSGLALRQGVTVLNSPGTIDADYRGEVQVILVNLADTPVAVARGERVAQLVVAPVVQATLIETKMVSETVRGAGGFGSTDRSTAARPKQKKNVRARPATVTKIKSVRSR